jgi:predicted nucleotide-binding protein
MQQSDVPAYSLDQALRVPRSIADNYARKPTPTLRVAAAMNMQPASSTFRMLTGAAIAYGLTAGGAQAPQIELTPLGLRIVHPLREGDDLAAKREAMLKPRVLGAFLRQYDNAPFPRREIARNVLIDLGVPDDRADSTLELILDGAKAVGFVQTIKDREYVSLEGAGESAAAGDRDDVEHTYAPKQEVSDNTENRRAISVPNGGESALPNLEPSANHRVFVTHGKNQEFLEPIKKLISFGKFEPVVAVERQSVSKPVPDKVMSDMRSCGAAIIHVDADQTIVDKQDKEHIIINPNVLIEIGAAMALYGRRFILLVREGVQLPSNLQGLYEVRYAGDTLDAVNTIRLLEAINDIQNNALPNRYEAE